MTEKEKSLRITKNCNLLLFLLILTSCATQITEQPAQREPIVLAWIGPLTGPVASLGIDNFRGIELAVKQVNEQGGINGQHINLIAEDDQMQQKNTLTSYQKVTTKDDARIVLSPSYSGLLTLAPLADASKTVMIDSLDTSEEIANAGDYTFGVGVYDEGIGFTLAEFLASSLKQTKTAVFYNNEDAFMVLVNQAFKEKFESFGGTLMLDESYTYDTKDFRTPLLKIKDSGATSILLLGYDEAGFIARQAQEVGVNTTLLGTDTLRSQNFLANAGSAAQGMFITYWDSNTEAYKKFIHDFTEKYGTAPQQPLYAAVGHDTITVLTAALANTQNNNSTLHNELYSLKNITGLSGTLSMSPDGIVRTVREQIFKYENESFVKAT